MTITDPIDVTPSRTFTTIQFESETLNVVANALVTVLILTNIGSITSKLVQITTGDHFSFKSFRRYIIFTSSDDPVRLFSWFRHRYRYHERGWRRHPQKINGWYLLLPMIARLVIFFVSIASIIIAIPGEKVQSGCDRGDYAPVLNTTHRRPADNDGFVCSDVPIISKAGIATSTFSYCSYLISSEDSFVMGVAIAYSKFGMSSWALGGEDGLHGRFFFFEWTKSSGEQFLTLPQNSIPAERLAAVIVEALNEEGLNCTRGELDTHIVGEDVETFVYLLNGCTFLTNDYHVAVSDYLISSFALQRRDGPDVRWDVENKQVTTDCPVQVVVSRPIVNLLPLSILLAVLFVINITVTWTISEHGNILDSTYHLVKETLGHDCMSNPLEESVEQMPAVDKVPLRHVRRGETGHVGFLKQADDEPVNGFDASTIVCGSVAPGEAVVYEIGSRKDDDRCVMLERKACHCRCQCLESRSR